MVNWKCRLKSKEFWIGVVGVAGTFAVGVAGLFGVDASALVGQWSDALTALVGAVFAVLALVGVVNDPTVAGLGDSDLALTRDEPKEVR